LLVFYKNWNKWWSLSHSAIALYLLQFFPGEISWDNVTEPRLPVLSFFILPARPAAAITAGGKE